MSIHSGYSLEQEIDQRFQPTNSRNRKILESLSLGIAIVLIGLAVAYANHLLSLYARLDDIWLYVIDIIVLLSLLLIIEDRLSPSRKRGAAAGPVRFVDGNGKQYLVIPVDDTPLLEGEVRARNQDKI